MQNKPEGGGREEKCVKGGNTGNVGRILTGKQKEGKKLKKLRFL